MVDPPFLSRMKRMERQFKSLASLLKENGKIEALRICIVTPDLIGPVKNGGIGTACANLACVLAQAGHEVEILFTLDGGASNNAWINYYTSKGINISFPPSLGSTSYFPDIPYLVKSLQVYEWLKITPDFDLVLFMDLCGNGFYPINAKKNGLAFKNTVLGTIVHSPTIWHTQNNASSIFPLYGAALWHMERACLEMSDFVISPSEYMLEWCWNHKYRLPLKSFFQPNPFIQSQPASAISMPIEEIVFFGRLEYRKGLLQFCTCLDILAKRRALPKIITFLGKCSWLGNEHCLEVIARHSPNWQEAGIRILPHCDNSEACEYLMAGGRLAVMPSVEDNSPYTVYEALVKKIPFLAADTGGICELVAAGDRKFCLFNDNPARLADKISSIIGKIPRIPRLAFNIIENNAIWLHGLQSLVRDFRNSQKSPCVAFPHISVCLTHYNRPWCLKQAVQSLIEQNYGNFEVILADDGSDLPEARHLLAELEPVFKAKGWRILRLDNGFTGRARNMAAKNAKGEWLIFFDDDNVAKKDMLKTFALGASQQFANVITTSFEVFEKEESGFDLRERYLPLGNILSTSVAINAMGDAVSLIRKEVFWKAGGFSEDYGLGNEDFELLLRLAMNGETFSVIPDSLFWYRKSGAKSSVNNDTPAFANKMRSMRPFLDSLAPNFAELALFSHYSLINGQSFNTANQQLPDPQSDEILEKIASNLTAEKRWEIVDAIYASLLFKTAFIPNIFKENFNKCLKLCRIADYAQVKKLLAGMEEQVKRSTDSNLKDAFNLLCLRAIELIPKSEKSAELRAMLMNNLANGRSPHISINLQLALEYSGVSPANAIACYLRGLMLADAKYLYNRPDVAKAVKNGLFISGLHHFMLHGRHENIAWPEAPRFAKTFKNLRPQHSELVTAFAVIGKIKNLKFAQAMLQCIS